MRRRWLVLVCCSLLLLPGLTRAQEAPKKAISFVRITNLPFQAAMRTLSRVSGTSFGVDSTIEHLPISLVLRDVPLEDAPAAALQQLEKTIPGLMVEKRKEGWVFKLREGAVLPVIRPTGPGSSGKVTVLLGKAPVRTIVEQLFVEVPGVPKPGPYKVEVEEGVPNVPIDLQHTANNEDFILSLVTRQAAASVRGLTMEQAGEHLTLGIRPDRRPPFGLFPKIIPPAQPKDRRIICVFEKYPLMEAMRMIAARARLEEGPLLGVEAADEIPAAATVSFRLVTNDPEVLLQAFFAEARKQIPGLGITRAADRISLTYRSP